MKFPDGWNKAYAEWKGQAATSPADPRRTWITIGEWYVATGPTYQLYPHPRAISPARAKEITGGALE